MFSGTFTTDNGSIVPKLLSRLDIGPRYSIESPTVDILGPSLYNIEEGEELALVCIGNNNNNIGWRKKVII